MTTIKFSQLPDLPLGNIDAGTYAPVVDAFTNYTVTMGNMTAYVNQNSGNISVTGTVSATGNITGAYILGNGSQLTGLPATYGNANVAAFLAAFGSNTITTTGNVVVGNVSGGNGNIDGKFYNLQGLTGNSTAYIGRKNATGQGNRAVFSFQNSTSNAFHSLQFQPKQVNLFADAYNSGTGLDTWAEVDMNVSNITSPFVSINLARSDTGAEIYWNYDITGNITLPGNASAINYANGTSILSGLAGTYGNANVVANLAALGSNPVSTTGNISASYFLGNGSQLTGIATAYGNANVAAFMASFGSNSISTSGNITVGTASASGNVTGNYILGNGALLTGIGGGGTSNANITNGTSYVSIPVVNGNIISYTANTVDTPYTYFVHNSRQHFNYAGFFGPSPGSANTVQISGATINMGGGSIGFNNKTAVGVALSPTIQFPRWLRSQILSYTGTDGMVVSISDSPTYTMRLAYWSTTGPGWRYVDDNTLVA